MKNVIFFFILCGMLTVSTVSAQRAHRGGAYDSSHKYLPGEWYAPNKDQNECGCRPTFYPVNNIISPTQFGCEVKKCIKSGRRKTTPKEATETPVLVVPIPDVAPVCTVYVEKPVYIPAPVKECCDTNIINITVIDTCCNSAPKPIMGEAETLWYLEGNGLLPTDREYSAFTPEVNFGFEVAGDLVEHPGLQIFFKAQATVIPGAFRKEETCPSCVPQDAKVVDLGVQIEAGVSWQFGKKTKLEFFRTSNVWKPFDRKVEPEPTSGWGTRLVFGKKNAAVKWHLGVVGKSGYTTPHVGVSINFGRKESGPRVLFQPNKLKRA